MGPVPHLQAPDAEQLSARVVSHETQGVPPVPQLANEGELSHVDPEQHPVLQPVELQSDGHTPAVHEPVLQATQGPPPLPHKAVVLPGSHVVPLQQPLGHDVGSHTHAPLTHFWPDAHGPPVVPQVHLPPDVQVSELMPQETHAAPPLPHVEREGASQVAPEQQPEGHEVASQTQVPVLHR